MSHPSWERSINGIGQTIEQLNNSSASLNRIVGSLEKELPEIGNNLASVSNDLKDFSGGLSQLDIKTTFISIDETANNLKLLTGKLNSNDNSLGLLLNDTKLYDSLSVTLDTASKLLEDIRQNPERYLTVRVRLF